MQTHGESERKPPSRHLDTYQKERTPVGGSENGNVLENLMTEGAHIEIIANVLH